MAVYKLNIDPQTQTMRLTHHPRIHPVRSWRRNQAWCPANSRSSKSRGFDPRNV